MKRPLESWKRETSDLAALHAVLRIAVPPHVGEWSLRLGKQRHGFAAGDLFGSCVPPTGFELGGGLGDLFDAFFGGGAGGGGGILFIEKNTIR